MNLEEYQKLIKYLRSQNFITEKKYQALTNSSEMVFEKIIDTDDKDIKLIIEGSFHYRIHEENKTKKWLKEYTETIIDEEDSESIKKDNKFEESL